MEGDYLELSQFFYNSHRFPHNFYPSPLGTTRFLTSGIRAIDFVTSNCDRRKLLKEIQQMVNKVSKDVKDISEKVKALVESKKAMKEEHSRLQEDLESMTEEELQSLDSMELEDQIKFQEFTTVVASQNVDFCVKVDDDIHVHAAPKVQSKEPTKKVMMIQESTTHEVVVGVNTSDPMVFDCGQNNTSINGSTHVIKNEGMK